jgi:hypothetical protein
LVQLLEQLIASIETFLRKRRLSPPAAVKNLTGAVNRSNPMKRQLDWTTPTTRVDGTPLLLTDIDHVDIFDVSTTDPLSTKIGTIPGASPAGTFLTDVLTVGIHNFTVQYTDTAGHVGPMSNVDTTTVAAVGSPPAAVTDLHGTDVP